MVLREITFVYKLYKNKNVQQTEKKEEKREV